MGYASRCWRDLGWIRLALDETAGVVQMYISRTDGFVWIERASGRPWLLTPDQPDEFVRALSRSLGWK